MWFVFNNNAGNMIALLPKWCFKIMQAKRQISIYTGYQGPENWDNFGFNMLCFL